MTTRDNVPEATEAATVAHALTALRADFPDHEIWREDDGGHVRYIARGQHPHTVVTADLGELRTALSGSSAQSPKARSPAASPVVSRFDPAMPCRSANGAPITPHCTPSAPTCTPDWPQSPGGKGDPDRNHAGA